MERVVAISARLSTALACAWLLLLLASAGSASAKESYEPFGHLPPPSTTQSYISSGAIAADSGRIYVADGGPHRIYIYDSINDKTPEEWTGANTPAGSFGSFLNVAVDSSDGSVYVSDGRGTPGSDQPGVVYKFNAAGNLIASFGDQNPPDGRLMGLDTPDGGLLNPFVVGIAVDQDTGNLYVTDADHRAVEIFDSSGNYLDRIIATENPFECDGWRLGALAFSTSNDHAYLADSCTHQVFDLDDSGTFLPPFNGSDSPAGVESLTPQGGFSEGLSVATDNTTGTIYIGDSPDFVDHFDLGGSYLGQFPVPHVQFDGLTSLGVDVANGDIYVIRYTGGVEGFRAPVDGAAVTADPASNVMPSTVTLTGHVDPDGLGDVSDCRFEYVQDKDFELDGFVQALTEPCTPSTPYTTQADVSADLSGLASGTTYHYRLTATDPNGKTATIEQTFTTPPAVTNLETGSAINIKGTSADLTGSFEGDGNDTHYYFEYGFTSKYGQVVPLPPGEDAGSGTGPQQVEPVTVSGLIISKTYHYRIVASNQFGISFGPDQTFKTLAPPTISTVVSSDVQSSSATLNGLINPNGAPTHYRFDYGTTTSYGQSQPVPDADVGSGTTFEPVSIGLTGLEVGATYHFRLVATNEWGTSTSEDQSFGFYPDSCPNSTIRQQTSSNHVPDCRAYELASPADANGTTIFTTNVPNSGYATNPSRIAFVGGFGIIPGAGGSGPGTAGDLYVATRATDGWSSKYIGLRGDRAFMMAGPPSLIQSGGLQQPDKSQTGVLTDPAMSKFADWDQGVLTNEADGLGSPLGDASHAPYLWDASGNSLGRAPSVLDNTANGEDALSCSYAPANGNYASCDEAAPLANSDMTHFAFTSEVDFTPDGYADVRGEIYDNDMDADTVTVASKMPDGTRFSTPLEVDFKVNAPALEYSDDGSHLLMRRHSNVYPHPDEGLYMRVNNSVTYSVSRGAATSYGASGIPAFVEMSSDGSQVLFTTESQLSPDDGDKSIDLYMWSEEGDMTTLISNGDTPGAGNSDSCNGSCQVSPITFSLSARNSHDSSVASANGDVYFFSPELLDLVPDPDLIPNSGGEENASNLYVYRNGSVRYVATLKGGGIERMQVTPNGKYATFLSKSRVTDYDNAGYSEMYRYAADTGELSCRSCLPNGSPPSSDVQASQSGLFMTEDGRTFFSTVDPLVARDTNAAVDVYEHVDGKPQLITSGTSNADGGFHGGEFAKNEPGLVGVSANGTDVYFATFDVFVPQDLNGQQLKIYDARTNGGFAFNPPLPPCVAADECHGAGSAGPAPLAAGTGVALGGGNANPTQRKAKRKHHKAKKKAKAKQKKQRARNSARKQGGGR